MTALETNELFKRELSKKQHRLTPKEVRQVQRVSLEITKDVADVCERHGIHYMLTGGTALGAIRHGGFIPWDDDIDMVVPRGEIDTLLDAIESEYPDKYEVEAPLRTPGYLSSFIQIHKRGTIFQEYLSLPAERCGIKIDIFVVENTYNNRLLRTLHGINAELDLFLLSCYRMFAWRKEFLALAKGSRKAVLIIGLKCAVGMLAAPFSEVLYRRTQLCLKRCKNHDSVYIAVPSGRKHYFGELCPRKEFMERCELPFEQERFMFPRNYDAYLRNMYGDYMTIPPEEQREYHVIYRLKF